MHRINTEVQERTKDMLSGDASAKPLPWWQQIGRAIFVCTSVKVPQDPLHRVLRM